MGSSFKEIEHKFIVAGGFDRAAFFKSLQTLSPTSVDQIHVEDTYYVLKTAPKHVFRYRYDQKISQLTLKSVEKTPFERTEVNLHLSHVEGSQQEAIEAFLGPMGLLWQNSLQKDVAVAYFPDCEIVHYRAKSAGRAVECVEFEATETCDRTKAFATLKYYEEKLGFSQKKPEELSLFELLLLADAPKDVVNLFQK